MKKLSVIGLMAATMVLSPSLSSCGDDDAPDKPNSSEVSNIDGTHVTKIGSYSVDYDEKGRPVLFSDSYDDEVEIDYSKGIIRGLGAEMKVKFNSKGFITELSASWDYQGQEYGSTYRYKGSGKYALSYNDNCLTTVKATSSESIELVEEKEKISYSGDLTDNYIWSKGNLVKIDHKLVEKENDEKTTEESETDITYGTDENRYRQFPMSVVYNSEILVDEFYAVGLFGNGPVSLPVEIEFEDNDDYSSSTYVEFTLNENGSISRESCRWESWNYSYSKFTRGQAFADQSKSLKGSIRNIFPHYNSNR